MKKFFLIVGKGGTVEPEDRDSVSNSDRDVYTKLNEIDQLFTFLRQNNVNKVSIHFHGGLVKQAEGIIAAENMASVFDRAGCFPIAFIWKTGIIEVAKQAIIETQSSNFFDKLKRIIIKQVAKRLGLQKGGRGIESLSDAELDAELKKEEPLTNLNINTGARGATMLNIEKDEAKVESEIEADLEPDLEELAFEVTEVKPSDSLYLNLSKVTESQEGARSILTTAKLLKAATTITIRVLKRFLTKKDHGFYATVVEEIYRELYIDSLGKIIWDGIKDKASNMWEDDQVGNIYVGSYFLERLDAYFEANPETKLDIVGHSAGSIVICHLLSATKKFKYIKIRNIIFLAPACRIDLFQPFIANAPLFTNFYLFTMKDEVERADKLVPVLYPHSLLYFVSGLLEKDPCTPILGLQRHFNAVEGLEDFLATRRIMSRTDGGSVVGRRSQSITHGDFDNDAETLESILEILKQ